MIQKRKRQQGFTLIELMAVVAILALLATIAIPGVVDAVHRGRAGTNRANRELLQSALLRHWADTGTWPGGFRRDDTLPTLPGPVGTMLDLLSSRGYIDRVPAVAGATPAGATWVLTWVGTGVRAVLTVNIPGGSPGAP